MNKLDLTCRNRIYYPNKKKIEIYFYCSWNIYKNVLH